MEHLSTTWGSYEDFAEAYLKKYPNVESFEIAFYSRIDEHLLVTFEKAKENQRQGKLPKLVFSEYSNDSKVIERIADVIEQACIEDAVFHRRLYPNVKRLFKNLKQLLLWLVQYRRQ
jgi:hypothetical protein